LATIVCLIAFGYIFFQVTAHLLDGTISDNLTLLYFSKHYEVAFFKLMGGSELQVASLEPKLEFGSEACVLAREKDLGLICRETKILALDPCDHQRNHYLFIGGSIPQVRKHRNRSLA